ncbi:metal ABC transporter solute-binding protein, Zn/Mn family [Marinicrinis sediminis]|uniref:Metal ABC transporter solute-binding protein, Zn/Mn family n=1 Tax=Marinicrinis sediminis TaxID=1652465 RepID=A0ABW5RDD7_9BACL
MNGTKRVGKGKHMKRVKWMVLIAVMILLLSACTNQNEFERVEGKVNVVTTFYPLQFLAEEIGGESAHVINLVPTGVDSHDWTPKSQDLLNMKKADMFIYNGAGFEGWVDDFLSGMDQDHDMKVVEASEGASFIYPSEVEMEEDHHQDENSHQEDKEHEEEHHDEHEEHGHEEEEHSKQEEHGHEEENHHEHEEEHAEEDAHAGHDHGDHDIDPHLWTSPKQLMWMAENVKEGFIAADPENQQQYEQNFSALLEELSELDAGIRQIVEQAARTDIVVSHNAYSYLARDYGLNQISVMGLSPEAEPTAKDIKQVSDFIKEHEVQYILFEELVSPEIAQMLSNDLGIETLVFNPLEGLTDEQNQQNENYISIMKENIETLKKALQ